MVRAWIVAVALTCGAAVASQTPSRPNVLLVTVDALRADRLRSDLTPGLWALASRGARFEKAYAHTPATLPSHASLLTGLVPPGHGVRANLTFRLDETSVTLAELFENAGYRTGAFIGGSLLDARYGLDQGFTEYDDRFAGARRDADDVIANAEGWIARGREPWFAWVHLFELHDVSSAARYGRYLSRLDQALAPWLRERAVAAVVVVSGDHGQGLGAHGENTHGLFAYDRTLRVPLLVVGPGIPSRVVPDVVSLVDVMPTILDLAGLTPRAGDGRSLGPALGGKTLAPQPVYFEALAASLHRGWAPLTGVVAGGWKYIDLPIPELYDLTADPDEINNRAANEPAQATRLRDLTIRTRTAGIRADGAGDVAEPAARARLRSLGYVGAQSWRLGAWRIEDDPKRLLRLHQAFEQALERGAGGRDVAVRELRALIAERPDFAEAYVAAGRLRLEGGRAADAVALLSEAWVGGLRQRIVAEALGDALVAAGRARDAVELLERVVEADQTAVEARLTLARAAAATGDAPAARRYLREALQLDPSLPEASQLLATLK